MTIYQRPWGSLTCHWGKDPMTEDRHFKWSSEPLCICLYLGLTRVLWVPRQVCYPLGHSGIQCLYCHVQTMKLDKGKHSFITLGRIYNVLCFNITRGWIWQKSLPAYKISFPSRKDGDHEADMKYIQEMTTWKGSTWAWTSWQPLRLFKLKRTPTYPNELDHSESADLCQISKWENLIFFVSRSWSSSVSKFSGNLFWPKLIFWFLWSSNQ